MKLKGKMRRSLSIIMVMAMMFTIVNVGAFAATKSEKNNVTVKFSAEVLNKTQAYIAETLKAPICGSIGGEWSVIGMARSNAKVPDAFYNNYISNVEKVVKDTNGILDKRKYTEYSRVILAYTALGKSVIDIGGYNFLENIADFDKVVWQGINGPIWALIALDSANYDIPKVEGVKTQTTRELLIKEILNSEIKGGGFSLVGDKPDPDITAMTLQALSNYYDTNKDVRAAVDRSLTVLSKIQNNDGGFSCYGAKNVESIAQVVVALTALGIDPVKDPRFIKEGKTVIDALLGFYDENGGFRHINQESNGYKPSVNQMATEQGLYALAAYDRFVNHEKSLYDMSDINQPIKPAKGVITKVKSNKTRTFSVTWKKISGADGYQIKYANNKKLSSPKEITVSASTVKKTIKSLKKGKVYYVSVRGYDKTASGEFVYGDYSKVKKVKVK